MKMQCNNYLIPILIFFFEIYPNFYGNIKIKFKKVELFPKTVLF